MSNSRFCCIVWCLGLWYVDDRAGHGADEHHATRSLAFHQVASYRSSEEVGSIYVNTPELADSVNWVVDGFEVFGEAGGCYEIVD